MYTEEFVDDYYQKNIVPDPTSWFEKYFGSAFYGYSDYKLTGAGDFCFRKTNTPTEKTLCYLKRLSGVKSKAGLYSAKIGFIFGKQIFVSELKLETVLSIVSAKPHYDSVYCEFVFDEDDERKAKKFISKVTVSHPALIDQIPDYYVNIIFAEDDLSAEERLKRDYPYAYEILKASDIPVELFYWFPSLELLYKAGYVNLVSDAVKAYREQDKDSVKAFRHICSPGHDLKSIFKSSKTFYQTICNSEKPLCHIDGIKKIDHKYKPDKDTLLQIINLDVSWSETTLNNLDYILGYKHQKKPVYSIRTLVNYIRRVDMYEAIEPKDALQYLADYLRSCRILRIKPRTDSDSLIREHNVAARLAKQKQAKTTNRKLAAACKKLQQYDWSKGNYFIRGVQSQADILDEATQQHNCLASYMNEIADGNAKIFVMRRCWAPEKSLITIEMSPDMKTVRQKLMAYNTQINSQTQLSFISEWVKAVQEGKTNDWDKIDTKLSYSKKCAALDEMYVQKAKSQLADI